MKWQGMALAAALLAAIVSPASALLMPNEERVGVIKAGMADAEKALQAEDANRARFHLLAVAFVAFDDAGWRGYVPEEVRAQFRALTAQAWPDEKTAEADPKQLFAALDRVVKDAAPRLLLSKALIVSEVETLDRCSGDGVARLFMGSQAAYPVAMSDALAFAADAPSPEWLNRYYWGGEEGFAAGRIWDALFNLQVGPGIIEKRSRGELLPDSLKEAGAILLNVASSQDPDEVTTALREARRPLDYAVWVDPGDARLKQLEADIEALTARAEVLYAAQEKENRVPTERYQGSNAEQWRQAFKQAYEKESPGRRVLRVSIVGHDWVERAVPSESPGDTGARIWRLLDAAVAAKDGRKLRVRHVTFGRARSGDAGKLGGIEIRRQGVSYPILQENVLK